MHKPHPHALLLLVAAIVSLALLQQIHLHAAPMQATTSLSGKVQDQDGNPIAGITILLINRNWENETIADTTDANGLYDFFDISSSSNYEIRTRDPAEFYAPATVTRSIGSGEAATQDFTLKEGARITGRVSNHLGEPLPDIKVTITDNIFFGTTHEAFTDANGDYTKGGLAANTYTLWASDLAQEYLSSTSVTVVLAESQSETQDFVLRKGARLSGAVTRTGGSPVEGVRVQLRVQSGSQWVRGAKTSTDAAGNWMIKDILPGTYKVSFTLPFPLSAELGDEYYNDKFRLSSADPIVLDYGSEEADIDALLTADSRTCFGPGTPTPVPPVIPPSAAGGAVTGFVCDADGAPIGGAEIEYRFGDYDPIWNWVEWAGRGGKIVANPDGTFALILHDSNESHVVVGAFHPGFVGEQYNDHPMAYMFGASGDVFSLTGGVERHGFYFQLDEAPPTPTPTSTPVGTYIPPAPTAQQTPMTSPTAPAGTGAATPVVTLTETPAGSPTAPGGTPNGSPTAPGGTPDGSPTAPGGTPTQTPEPPLTTPTPTGNQVDVAPTTNTTQHFPLPGGAAINLAVPNGAVDTPTRLTVENVAAGLPDAGHFRLGALAFRITASQGGDLVEGMVFAQPLTLEISYTDAQIEGITEEVLALKYYNESAGDWRSDGIEVVSHDLAANRLTVRISHLTLFALAEGASIKFLPAVTGQGE